MGAPTKTQILDGQKGRTQLANLTMSAITLLVVLFITSVLTDMPKAVLGAIVLLIGFDLIDIRGLHNITFALTRAGYCLLDRTGEDQLYGTLGDAVSAFRARIAGRPGELSGGINQ